MAKTLYIYTNNLPGKSRLENLLEAQARSVPFRIGKELKKGPQI